LNLDENEKNRILHSIYNYTFTITLA